MTIFRFVPFAAAAAALLAAAGTAAAQTASPTPSSAPSTIAKPTPAPAAPPAAAGGASVPGVTFADTGSALYVPARALGDALGLTVRWANGALWFGDVKIPEDARRRLYDGSQLVAVRGAAKALGSKAAVAWDPASRATTLTFDGKPARIVTGPKRVYVSIDRQRLRALQGDFVVLDTNVSTGRPGHSTPRGSFTAGPLKTPMLISHKYNDAEMPWSVQVVGDVVIHGFPSVPPRAASHGCVRMPLTGYNPALYFYRWVDLGTPITISGPWPEAAAGKTAGASVAKGA